MSIDLVKNSFCCWDVFFSTEQQRAYASVTGEMRFFQKRRRAYCRYCCYSNTTSSCCSGSGCDAFQNSAYETSRSSWKPVSNTLHESCNLQSDLLPGWYDVVRPIIVHSCCAKGQVLQCAVMAGPTKRTQGQAGLRNIDPCRPTDY